MKTWKPFFIWKNKCSLDMGVEVIRLPPLIRARQRLDEITVPGRNGSLCVTDGTFEPVVKLVEIGMLGGATDRVFEWLRGAGDVIFSTEPGKRYEAVIVNKIPLEQVIRQIRKGQVQFSCYPFKYEIRQEPIELTRPMPVTNPGTVESEPVMTVYGQGDITVSVNGRTFSLFGITDYVVIDSPMLCAYRTESQLMNQNMAGEFPYFDVGENMVSWTGNVSKITILPYWRWL